MPREKPPEREGQAKTRTRTGCKECRSSRVRCDEKKPSCTRCYEKGLVCSTPVILKWESEFISRGQAFGRAGVWNKARRLSSGDDGENGKRRSSLPSSSLLPATQEWCRIPTIHNWSFVNSGFSTFQQHHQATGGKDDLNALVLYDSDLDSMMQNVSPSLLVSNAVDNYGYDNIFVLRPLRTSLPDPLSSPSLFPNMPASQRQLFYYYLLNVCPRTTPSSKSSSPFASMILPFCMTASPTTFKAIEALGACHWSRFNSNYSSTALQLKSAALRDLRYRLATNGFSLCSMDSEVLVVIMMLCICEIVDHCDQRWTVHLKGAKELIRFRRQQTSELSPSKAVQAQDPVCAFAESFFAFQDVIGRTACGEEVLFGSDYWQENDRTVDLWMGCSPELVSILSSITEMSRTRRRLATEAARSSFSQQAALLANRLENLTQEASDEEEEALATVAELKRLAAILYLHCALYGASPSTPLVIDYVRKILKLVSELLDRGSVVSVTFPVFVAAAELDPQHDELWTDPDTQEVYYGRPLVLRALAAMEKATVSSIARTRAVIVKIWQARDLNLLKVSPAASGRDPADCNDWEWHVAPISTAMSLA